MNEQLIEQIVKEVMQSMNGAAAAAPAKTAPNISVNKVSQTDYPLADKRPELLLTPTGKPITDITLKGVLNGEVGVDDIRISPETLELQAQVADSVGRKPFAKNLRRAAELISVPDDRILEIYNALRPHRSTRDELLAIADELENKYNAVMNANLVRESAKVYEQRDRLKKD